MELESGFYTYTPRAETKEDMHELSLPQVIQVIEDEVWLTGLSAGHCLDYVQAVGIIGKMVMDESGEIK